MSESYESILEAARRLTAEEQRELAQKLLAGVAQDNPARLGIIIDDELPRRLVRHESRRVNQSGGRAAGGGIARRHFGVWDSGDVRSADNERIDRDLEREYDNSR